MRLILLTGIISLWVLYVIVNTGWFLPYGVNHAANVGNIIIFIVLISIGVAALASIPGGYLYWAVEKFWRKRKIVLQTKHFYQIWLLLLVLIMLVLVVKIFNVV